MATTLVQAAIDALAAFLQGELLDVKVRPYWAPPSADKPELAVTITRVGRERQLAMQFGGVPTVSRDVVPPDPVLREFRFDVDMLEQRIQIDCWADREPDLLSLEAALNVALRRGEDYTLGTTTGASPVRDGVLLAINEASGHDGFVDFNFDDGAEADLSADNVMRSDYRSVIFGSLTMRYSIWATTPKQAEIILRSRVSTQPLSQSVPAEETTVLPLPPEEA